MKGAGSWLIFAQQHGHFAVGTTRTATRKGRMEARIGHLQATSMSQSSGTTLR
jgi:hypothetical protein